MIGNKYHIINPAHGFLTIMAKLKPIEKDKNGEIASINVMPQTIYFLLFVLPLLSLTAAITPSNAITYPTAMAIF